MLQPRHCTAGLIGPFLPSPAKAPPSGPDWLHEIKHDGFRILARRDAHRATQGELILSGRCSLGIRVFGRADCIESLLHGQLIKWLER